MAIGAKFCSAGNSRKWVPFLRGPVVEIVIQMEIFSSSKQFQESRFPSPEWSEQPHLGRKIRAEYKAPLYELIRFYNFVVNLTQT